MKNNRKTESAVLCVAAGLTHRCGLADGKAVGPSRPDAPPGRVAEQMLKE